MTKNELEYPTIITFTPMIIPIDNTCDPVNPFLCQILAQIRFFQIKKRLENPSVDLYNRIPHTGSVTRVLLNKHGFFVLSLLQTFQHTFLLNSHILLTLFLFLFKTKKILGPFLVDLVSVMFECSPWIPRIKTGPTDSIMGISVTAMIILS